MGITATCIALLHDCPEDTSMFGNQFTDGYYLAMEDARFRLTRAFNAEVAEDVITLTIPKMNIMDEKFSSKTKCLKFYKEKLSLGSVRALLGKLLTGWTTCKPSKSRNPWWRNSNQGNHLCPLYAFVL